LRINSGRKINFGDRGVNAGAHFRLFHFFLKTHISIPIVFAFRQINLIAPFVGSLPIRIEVHQPSIILKQLVLGGLV